MAVETVAPSQLEGVTGGRFLPRTRSWAFPIAFTAAALVLAPVANYMTDHGIGQLRVPPRAQ
jgi:hypothetical protein